MSDRKGSRYDAIDALTEDVEELTKEVSKLITTSNKRGKEIIELRDSNNEIVMLLRDMRNLVSKEAMQRLHQQISTTATSEINALGQVLRDEMEFRLQAVIKEQVTEDIDNLGRAFQEKLGRLEQFLQQVAQQLSPLREEVRMLPTEARVQEELQQLRTELRTEFQRIPNEGLVTEQKVTELLAALREEIHLFPTEERVQEVVVRRTRELLAPLQEDVALMKDTHPSDERVQELIESRVTEERVRELLSAEIANLPKPVTIAELLREVPPGLTAEQLEERLSALPKGLTREEVQELLSTLPKGLTEERVRVLLAPYISRDDILREDVMRQILDLVLDTAMKQERDRASQFYVSKETANARYLLRDEFDAMKSIMVTRNDLETLGKNELDELRSEQETMRRSAASREHLKLLKGEFEDVRNRCEVLEKKLETVNGTLTLESMVAPVPTPAPVAEPHVTIEAFNALQQQVKELTVILPENKTFTVGGAIVKYLKVGDSRFLLSSGFPLTTEELDFHLVGIELPEAQQATQSQKEFSSTLTPDGHLLFRRLSEGAVVKRFMFWY